MTAYSTKWHEHELQIRLELLLHVCHLPEIDTVDGVRWTVDMFFFCQVAKQMPKVGFCCENHALGNNIIIKPHFFVCIFTQIDSTFQFRTCFGGIDT